MFNLRKFYLAARRFFGLSFRLHAGPHAPRYCWSAGHDLRLGASSRDRGGTFFGQRQQQRTLRFERVEDRCLLTSLTWAPQGANPTVWSTSVGNWYDPLLQTQEAWQLGDIAVFSNSNTSGTVVVNVSGDVAISGIEFAAGSWDIKPNNTGAQLQLYQNSKQNTIQDDNQEPVANYTVVNDTIEAPIVPLATGNTDSGLEMTGPGDVELTSGSNSLPGGVTLVSGALTIAPGALGSSTPPIYVNPGAGQTVALTFDDASGSAVASSITLQSGTLRIDAEGQSATLSGPISGGVGTGLVISDTKGNDTVTLSGNNTGFDGSLTIVSGTLKLGGTSVLGDGPLAVDGGVLDLGGPSSTYTPLTTFSFTGGGIVDGTLNLTSTLNADIPEGDSAFIAETTTVTGSAGLTVSGGGTLLLLGLNDTYSGATTVDGSTLVYRWNNGATNSSIPGGPSNVQTENGGQVYSELAYFGANSLIWNGTGSSVWDTTTGNTDWLAPGATGTTPACWTDSSKAVFEEPVAGAINVSGTVTVGAEMTFMTGSDWIKGGETSQIDVDASALTSIKIGAPNTTEYFQLPVGGGGVNGGLALATAGNLCLLQDNSYHGTTQLCSGAAINFVDGGLSDSAVVVAAGTGTAALVFQNPNDGSPRATLTNSITIQSGTARIDPSDQSVRITGTIGGSGALELGDSVGGGVLTLAPSDGNGNRYTAGTFLKSGTLSISGDDALGTAPATATTNITFSGNSTLQWAGSFGLFATRSVVIDQGETAEIDTQSYSAAILGAISGNGALTAIGGGYGSLTLSGDGSGFFGSTTVTARSGTETLYLGNPTALENSTLDLNASTALGRIAGHVRHAGRAARRRQRLAGYSLLRSQPFSRRQRRDHGIQRVYFRQRIADQGRQRNAEPLDAWCGGVHRRDRDRQRYVGHLGFVPVRR